MRLAISQIAPATHGYAKLASANEKDGQDIFITSISTDSRSIKSGALFVPIVGESFDGHDFITQAAEKGAVCVLTQSGKMQSGIDIPYIEVNCTRKALLDLAAFYLQLVGPKVIGITGSAGKTTLKDMIASVLEKKYRTKKTIGNFNNDIGMPLSVFALEVGDEVIVLEMGMNHAGEITPLSRAAKPDIAVITNIGDAHIENFKNREGILHAKLEILDGLKKTGCAFFNGDDPLLTGHIAAGKTSGLNAFYPNNSHIIAKKSLGLMGTECRFIWKNTEVHVVVPLPGDHMVKNALLAAAVCLELGCSPENICAGFTDFQTSSGRLNILHAGGKTIINDVYNSSPDALKNSLLVLSEQSGRKAAILGDMLELGHMAEIRHKEAGEFAAELGLDVLITSGELARFIHESYKASHGKGIAIHLESKVDFGKVKDDVLQDGDTVLIKASRGAKFEEITEIFL